MKDEDRDDKLISAASKLATGISPERDLWPAISEEISRPKRLRRVPMLAQAAAIVLLVGASSGVTYLVVKEEPQVIQVAMQDLNFEQTAFGATYTLGSIYRSAQGNYQATLDEQLERLSPEVRADVNQNLDLIRGAIDQIDQALDQHPDSVLLQELLVNSYREQHALMRRVGTLTQRVMARKDI
jgi:hypothetical protein